MRIVRVHDGSGAVVLGREHEDGVVTALDGDLGRPRDTGRRVDVGKVLAPIAPAAILGIGLNYRGHARETGRSLPERPVVFMKNPASVQNPGDPIVIPAACSRGPEVDYECELAVVIGRAARNVAASGALGHVLGYTAANDVSARMWQRHGGEGQWVRGKSFDTFCPLGPAIVTTDEIEDPQSLGLRTLLNGRAMQDSSTADMIFTVAEIVAFLSEDTTLVPGTVILTGTPEGVGFTRDPAVFLAPGDVVSVEVERIGTLVNPVRASR